MVVPNLLIGLFVAAVAGAAPPLPSGEAVAETPVRPALSSADCAYLTRVARRTLRRAALGQKPYEPEYVPASLEALSAEAIVRLRQEGYLLGMGGAGPAPIVSAVRDAALAAMGMMAGGKVIEPDFADALLVELEILGPAVPIPAEADFTVPRAVDAHIEPGVHGVMVLGPRSWRRICPTDLITSDKVLAEVLGAVARQTHGGSSQLAGARLERFRTVHWSPGRSGDEIVTLHRGMTIVPPDSVSAERLDDVIDRLARYMVYRQLKTGLFTYQYEPAEDRYSETDNLVRQVGATLAMAVHARRSGRSASLAAADSAIRHHLQGLTPVPGSDRAAYIATADGQNKLGVTALLCLALAEHPERERYAETRERLIRGMLWLQRPSGMFVTAFPPARQISGQEYFPGEALLALAKQYEIQPSAEILEAFDRAIEFYRRYAREARSPALVPWQSQAFALMAKYTKREDYAAFVFELTDWLCAMQLSSSNCLWPELWGGIAAYQPGRVGVATAVYLEGFTDALVLARSVGDTERARRYERVVREAARFVMQLQVRPEETYYIRSPRDAIDGIRTTPSLNLLRIDHCQHALVGLMKTRRVLFPDEE